MKRKPTPKYLIALLFALAIAACIFVFLWLNGGEETNGPDVPEPSPSAAVAVEPVGGGSGEDGENPGQGTPPPLMAPPDEPEYDINHFARYLNNKVLTYYFGDGDYISLGVDLGLNPYADAIYLNPYCSRAELGEDVAFYFYTDSTPVTTFYTDPSDTAYQTVHNFALTTDYNSMKPATYLDSQRCGTVWMDERMSEGGYGGADLYIRAVGVGGNILALCKATINYDPINDTYQLMTLEGTDVRETGALDENDRAALLEWTFTRLSTGLMKGADVESAAANIMVTQEGTFAKEELVATSSVEYLGDRTYFPYVHSLADGKTGRDEFVSDYKDLVAVNLNCGLGYFTAYFSPDHKVKKVPQKDETDTDTEQPEEAIPYPENWFNPEPVTSKALYFVGWDAFIGYPKNSDTTQNYLF